MKFGCGAFLTALVVVFFSLCRIATAEDATDQLNRQSADIYNQILSPFCPGRSLNDCPSSQAQQLKDKIRTEIQAGKPREDILNKVFAEYGDQYRAVPTYAGFGRFIWWIPIVFVGCGLLVIAAVVFGRRSSPSVSSGTSTTEIPAGTRREIEEELERLE